MRLSSQILAAAGAALILSGCGGGGSSNATGSLSPLGSSALPDGAPPAKGQPLNWELIAGDSRRHQALVANDFFPDTVTIDEGDSVTWTTNGSAHTLTIGRPPQNFNPNVPTIPAGNIFDGTQFVNAPMDSAAGTPQGLPGFVKTFTLTFTKAGTYHYLCIFHAPEMAGTIVVNPKGTPYPHAQGFYTGSANAEINSQLAAAQSALGLFPFALGGTHLAAGISGPAVNGMPPNPTVLRFTNQRYLGPNDASNVVTIAAGGMVTWTNASFNEPHTITFVPAGQADPDPFSPPSGPSSYDGTTLVNSGLLFPGSPDFSLTFPKAGTYTYKCLLHDSYGMVGTVVVR